MVYTRLVHTLRYTLGGVYPACTHPEVYPRWCIPCIYHTLRYTLGGVYTGVPHPGVYPRWCIYRVIHTLKYTLGVYVSLSPVCRGIWASLDLLFSRFTVGRYASILLLSHIWEKGRHNETERGLFYPFHCWTGINTRCTVGGITTRFTVG